MTLSRELRKALRAKLDNISERQLLRRIGQTATKSGIPNRDVAGLVLAHEQGMVVDKPMYKVKKEVLEGLEKHLNRRAASVQLIQQRVVGATGRKRQTISTKRVPKFLNFEDRYPAIFYKRLEFEINQATGYGDIPSAVFVLCRKMVENLLYNLLQLRYGGRQITKYFDTRNRRPLDFGVLIENLKTSKSDFRLDQHAGIDKFLALAHPFRENANSKAHNLLDYAESMKEIRGAKVPEMVELLLMLIEATK